MPGRRSRFAGRPACPLAAAAGALLAGQWGCAPLAPYRGPVPAAGAVRAFAGDTVPAGVAPPPPATLEPGSADPARHHLGRLVRRSGGGPFVALVYGDSRPGYRMESNSPAYYPVVHMFRRGIRGFLVGMAWTPVFVLSAVLPTLDGPRDAITELTKRPGGGAEASVRRALEAERAADLVVHAGDIVFDGRRGRLWEDFARRTGALRARALMVAAPGNHERTYDANAAAAWAAVLGDPAEPDRFWFSFDVPEADARFVVLDTNVLTDAQRHLDDARESALCDAQLDWMDDALAGTQRLKVVVLHHPLISTGHYARDWGVEESAAAARRRARVFEICARRGVDAVIAGHEHLYFRARLRGAGGADLWHVTSGGGGSPLYPIDRRALQSQLDRTLPAGWTLERGSVRYERSYHFARLELPDAGSRRPALWIACRVRGNRAVAFDTLTIGGTP